ncbi:MAG: pseudouridine synthase [Eubacteriaceae bacterium]
MRINRYLAQSALASRRKCEEYITSGKVKVNGKTVTDLSYDVKESDYVTVDNKLYKPASRKVYLMLNKPKGYITTMEDEKGRKTVMDLIEDKYKKQGVFPIGRLDYATEGLLLLTNDGDCAYRLTHPKYESEKEYKLTVMGAVDAAQLNALRNPIDVEGKVTKGAKITIIDFNNDKTELLVTITEGKNRQIRRMCEAAGIEVYRLIRVSMGGLYMKGLQRGASRLLTKEEISVLTGNKVNNTKGIKQKNDIHKKNNTRKA